MNRDILAQNQEKSALDETFTVTSKGLAYGATATGYLVDYTLLAGNGAVGLVAMCPGILFAGSGNIRCLPLNLINSTQQALQSIDESRVISPDKNTKENAEERPLRSSAADDGVPSGLLGPRIYDSTESWREDSRAMAISRAYRKVALCFANRGDQENLIKAYRQMQWLSDSPLIDQVSAKERRDIADQSIAIKQLLLIKYPSFEMDMERQNRQIVGDLLKASAPGRDWRNPKDGTIWRLLNVGVPTTQIAQIACSYIEHDKGKHQGQAWRIPHKKELQKALEEGLLAANPVWGVQEKDIRVFATSSASPPIVSLFMIKNNTLSDIPNNSSPANLLCVL